MLTAPLILSLLATASAGCVSPFSAVLFADMHDGDTKTVALSDDGKLTLSQSSPVAWTLTVPVDLASCTATVDFSKSSKPAHPPVPLLAELKETSAGDRLVQFSDPSGTLKPGQPNFPLNLWEEIEPSWSSPFAAGISSVYGKNARHLSVDIAAAGEKLLSQLDFAKGIQAANITLWTDSTLNASFHLFATNRTEACHFHKGTTVSQTIHGSGAFRVPYSSTPVPQNAGDTFVIPRGEAHAFGPAPGVVDPVLVTVLWSPPFHSNYTVPISGCQGA